jgi:hypothetical protein
MTDKKLVWILTITGIITGILTIGSSVINAGEIKGSIMTMLQAHERRLEEHAKQFEIQSRQLSGVERQIDRIKDRVGIASLKPDSSATAALPPCIETEPEQQTR